MKKIIFAPNEDKVLLAAHVFIAEFENNSVSENFPDYFVRSLDFTENVKTPTRKLQKKLEEYFLNSQKLQKAKRKFNEMKTAVPKKYQEIKKEIDAIDSDESLQKWFLRTGGNDLTRLQHVSRELKKRPTFAMRFQNVEKFLRDFRAAAENLTESEERQKILKNEVHELRQVLQRKIRGVKMMLRGFATAMEMKIPIDVNLTPGRFPKS